MEDERAVGQPLVAGVVKSADAGSLDEPLAVKLSVDRVGAVLVRVKRSPDLGEPVVVGSPALRARSVPGRQRRRLIQEEQLGVAPWRHQRRPAPTTELKPASDPPAGAVSPADLTVLVVEAATVAVNEPALGRGDQIAER